MGDLERAVAFWQRALTTVANPAADLLQEKSAIDVLSLETQPCDKERSAMLHPRYSSAEIVQRGQVLYDQQIRAHVEASHAGKFLVLDIETGDYEIDVDDVAALQRAKARHPDAAFYILRVGTPTAYRLGGQRLGIRP